MPLTKNILHLRPYATPAKNKQYLEALSNPEATDSLLSQELGGSGGGSPAADAINPMQLRRDKKLAAKDQHAKEVQSRKQIKRLADANALLNSQLEEKSRKHLRARKARAISGLTEVSANCSAAAPVGKRTVVAEAKHCGRHTDEAKDEADEIWKKKCSFLSTKR